MQKNLLSIGQALKERREAQKISLKKVADQTKINISLLQAIEEGRVEPFPVHAYLRGFILAYAKALGLDEKEWEEELKALSSTEENVHLSEVAGASGPVESLIEKDMRLTPVILATLILFVLGSILVLANILSSHQEKKDLSSLAKPSAEKPENKLSPAKGLSDTDSIKATEDSLREAPPAKKEPAEAKKDRVEAQAGPSPTKDPVSPSEEGQAFRAQSDTPESDAKTAEESEPKKATESDAKTAEEPEPKKASSGKATEGLEIIVKALEKVRVHYRVDEGKRESVLLVEDQFKVLKGRISVFVRTRHSDLIYIFRNGKDLGLFGPGGRKEQTFSSKEKETTKEEE